jgi:hypothetical protein
MFIFKTLPQPIASVMRDGFRLFRQSIAKVWYWAVLIMIPGAIFSYLLKMDSSVNISPFLFLLFIVLFFVAIFLYVFGMGLIAVRVHAVAIQGDTSIKAAAAVAIRKMLPILAGGILLYVGFGLLIIPALSTLPLIVNTAVGITALIVTGILFLVFAPLYFYIFPFFILFEDKSIFAAIKASAVHMQGNIWRTIFMAIVLYAIGILVGLVIILLGTLLGYLTIGGVGYTLSTFTLPLIAYGFLLPLTISMFMVLYYDVKQRKAGALLKS